MRYDVTANPRILARGDALLPAPVIVRVGDIDEESALTFQKDIDRAHQTGQAVIPVVIESYGGDAYSLLSMIAAIKAARLPVFTIVEGKAMSAASMLFSYGSHRFMAERATLMVHDVSSTMPEGKTHEVQADASENARLSDLLFREMARNCGKPEQYFLDGLDERKHAEWYMTARDAKHHGFIRRAGLPTLAVEVAVRDVLVGPDGCHLLTAASERRTVEETTRKRRAR